LRELGHQQDRWRVILHAAGDQVLTLSRVRMGYILSLRNLSLT
jgi:16S rRNA U516 pseudouridylate synthase RsuA-like enzyme